MGKDADFISADKYDGNVMTSGEVGKIGTCRVVRSKKVKLNSDSTCYLNPIVKLTNDAETEEDDSFKKIKIWKIALKKEKYNFIISTKKFLILSGPIKIKQNYKVKYHFVLFIISKKQNQKLLSHYDLYNNQIIKSKHYINLSNQ